MMRRRDCLLTACHCSLWALPAMAAAPKAPLILVVGDSISAEYGLARGQGWVALLAQRLTEKKLAQQVQNASISGDTTSGGLARLPALLSQHKPAIVIIELGGNDALRGLPLASSRANLRAMVQAAKAAGAKVLLLGMQVPPNYGASYQREFAAMFEQVASQDKAALVPFLLKGIADQADAQAWFQPDRIHPLARAHPLMLELVWQGLKPLL
jgi:acyl-CoA thioesterase-1